MHRTHGHRGRSHLCMSEGGPPLRLKKLACCGMDGRPILIELYHIANIRRPAEDD